MGVQGGILAGTSQTREHALNHSRSWLLSGSQPPGVAAAQKAAVEVIMDEPEHVERLWANTDYFRRELDSLGFDTGVSTTPIIPVMCGESTTAKSLSSAMRDAGVSGCNRISYGCKRQGTCSHPDVGRSNTRRS